MSIAAFVGGKAPILRNGLRGRLGGLEERRMAVSLAKISCASLAMGFAAHYTSEWLAGPLPPAGSLWRAVQLATAIAAGLAVLVAFARMLRIGEFDEASSRVLERLRPRR